jgi:alkylhydroperoxidase family enzyme
MHTPALADRVEHLESYFRTEGELSAADRELIILATVREADARFAWARHEVRAKEAGTRAEAVEVLRAKSPSDKLLQRERTIVDLVRTLLREHAVSDELYTRAMNELGKTQLVEAVVLMGNYSLIGLLINTFAIPEDSQTF